LGNKNFYIINVTLPNQLSILRIVLSPLFLYFFLSDNLLLKKLSVAVYLLATITDWYDGWHARKFGVVTKTGIFLDPLADKILTSCAFIGFYVIGMMPVWMVILIVVRDISLTIMRSYSEMNGKTLPTSYIAKVKTFVQMTYIFGILLLMFWSISTKDLSISVDIGVFLLSPYNFFLMLLVTFLTVYTGIMYFFEKKS
jgi:CDP-diacylglycerol--glycerol-3-phosphate 3-phosphatidyltransferase